MKKENKIKAGFGICVIGLSVFIAGLLIGASVSEPIVNQPSVEKGYMKKVDLDWLGEAVIALNVSGVLEVYIWANGGTYTTNLSNASASCYASGDVNNTEIGTDVPYNTAFDVVVKVQWNYSHAFNETSGWYDLDFVQCFANSTDLGVASAQADEYEITNVTEQWYMHFVWDNGGAGYQISRNEQISSFYMDFEAYYEL